MYGPACRDIQPLILFYLGSSQKATGPLKKGDRLTDSFSQVLLGGLVYSFKNRHYIPSAMNFNKMGTKMMIKTAGNMNKIKGNSILTGDS